MIVWAALAMLLIVLLQVPSLISQKKWGELAGFSIVWTTATLYALLVAAEAPLPNAIELLLSFYRWFYPLIGVNFNI
ncbi:MAG: hypothetical protein ACOX30_04335 [Dethiobacteria bacterium]